MPKISAIDCNVSKPTLKAPFSIRDIACCLVFIFSANSACDIPACSPELSYALADPYSPRIFPGLSIL